MAETNARICAGLLSLLLLAGCVPSEDQGAEPPLSNIAGLPGGSSPYAGAGPVLTPPEASPSAEIAADDAPTPAPPEEVWTYGEHYSGAEPLQPWNGYGALLPYVGRIVADQDTVSCTYGLCTPQGALVTDPIYGDLTYGHGFLILVREGYTTVAAQDGSWVAPETADVLVDTFEDLAVLQDSAGGLTCWDGQGQQTVSFPAELFTLWYGEAVQNNSWNRDDMPGFRLTGRQGRILYACSTLAPGEDADEAPLRLYLDLESGAVLSSPPDGYPESLEADGADAAHKLPDGNLGIPCRDPYTGTQYYEVPGEAGGLLYDEAGNLLTDQVYTGNLWAGSPVLAGRTAVISAFAADPQTPFLDWMDLSTGAVVFRYRPAMEIAE